MTSAVVQVVPVVVLALSLLSVVHSERQRFDGHRVYRLHPQTEQQLEALRSLEANNNHKDIIFLDALRLGGRADVIIAPQTIAQFTALLEVQQMQNELLDEDAQATLAEDIEPVADANRRSAADDYTWTEYHELNDTYQWLHQMAAKYPNRASVFTAGETYEGRKLLGIRIAHTDINNNNNITGKQAIFLEAGIHAREWISPATATYFANELLTASRLQKEELLTNYVWYILPHANPDGFVYTHRTNRLWRKTRSPQGKDCIGTDPNRNWGFHWREVGASSEPCSEAYAGPSAFSEMETKTLGEFLKNLPEPMFMYISLHSFSQLLLYPYGHTSTLPDNHAELEQIFSSSVAAIKRRYGTRYTGGNVYDAIYPAAGSSMDWAYGVLGVKYAFTYELRPSGHSFWTGFRLPASQIIPTGQETTDSLIEMVKTAMTFS